jgi:hypothetical protein
MVKYSGVAISGISPQTGYSIYYCDHQTLELCTIAVKNLPDNKHMGKEFLQCISSEFLTEEICNFCLNFFIQ